MKTLALILLVWAVDVKGYLIKVPTSPVLQPSVAPVGWVHVQNLLLPLFENVCEESKNPVVVKLSQEFKLDMTDGNYLKPDVVNNLKALQSGKGLLPQGEIFTEYNNDHVNELKVIYELFYYAKDFHTFYKAACWARQHLNCGLFVDALYIAILNRRDTEKISLPAPYEILPNYFIRKDFITKASLLVAGDEVAPTDNIRNDGNSYILDVNYTTNFYDSIDESKLAYFHEDIGLNSYYFFNKLKMSPWITTDTKDNTFGEHLYFMMKQLMARYNLERYSNGLPELEGINWDNLLFVPYDPMLIYSNGNDFSHNPFTNIEDNEKLALLNSIGNNIATVVTHMRDGGFSKSDIINHLMEILITSDKGYENLALQILCEDNLINNRPPSVLAHYMTTPRDPVFWAINKKIIDLVDNALKVLPGYTKNELYFPGVEVSNVEVKKMITTFDTYDFDVTDALKTGDDDTKFTVKISQSRLNHKPFSMKVNISSLVTQKGLLKIYLGPKVMPGELALKKNLFMLLDCFEINLKVGSNVITRTSSQMTDNSDDLLSFYAIRKKLADAEFGLNSFTAKSVNEQIKFPSRLVIPKGLTEGLPLQIFVFVAPFVKAIGGRTINTEINKEALFSPGYPLDLDIEVRQLFDLPNAFVKDVIVTHKGNDEKVSSYGGYAGPRPWQSVDYDTPSESIALPLGARPEFTLRKEPVDYKSKRMQYGKKENIAVTKGDYKYKKDYTQQVDKNQRTDDTDMKKVETTEKNIIIPEETINTNDFGYIVSTDKNFDETNNFSLDKKFEGKKDIATREGYNKNFALHVDKNAITDDKYATNVETEKVITIPGTVKTNDFEYTVSTDKYFDEANNFLLDKKIHDKEGYEDFHIDITKNEKNVANDSYENSEEFHNNINKKETIDISKTKVSTHPPEKKDRLPTLYDIIFNPFDDDYGWDDRVYE